MGIGPPAVVTNTGKRAPARQGIPFGKYVLLERVSVGGMAEVFKAKTFGIEGFEKIIAIKRILPTMAEDQDFIEMFIDEAKIVSQLSHANVVPIFELGKLGDSHYIAMEYVWGKDLLQIMNRFRRLKQLMPVPMAVHVAVRVCDGLDYAHRRKDVGGRPLGIVHRDVSPQNVLISYEGEIKIIDFGIAKAAARQTKTQAGVLKGKFGYMSPEQVRGEGIDRRSDVFAAGTVLYEMLTGERLFLGESDFSTLEKVRNADVDPPSRVNAAVPKDLEEIVMKALARDPEKRWQWAGEMSEELQRFGATQKPLFNPGRLSNWMQSTFAADLQADRERLEEYQHIGHPGAAAAGAPASTSEGVTGERAIELDDGQKPFGEGAEAGKTEVVASPFPILGDPALHSPELSAQPTQIFFSNEEALKGDKPLPAPASQSTKVLAEGDAPKGGRDFVDPFKKTAGFETPAAVRTLPVTRTLPSPVGVKKEDLFDAPAPAPAYPTPAAPSRALRVVGITLGVLLPVGALAALLFAAGRHRAAGHGGTLWVTTTPDPHAEVAVNGVSQGRAPLRLEQLAVGSYEVGIAAPGYAPLTRRVAVRSGGIAVLAEVLTALALPGQLVLSVDPASSAVVVDGRSLAPRELFGPIRLAPGAHALRVSALGRQPSEETIAITSGATLVRQVRLEILRGTLSIRSEPTDSQVIVEGRARGRTPLELGGFDLDRAYHVLVRKHGLPSWTKTVIFTADAPRVDIEAPLGPNGATPAPVPVPPAPPQPVAGASPTQSPVPSTPLANPPTAAHAPVAPTPVSPQAPHAPAAATMGMLVGSSTPLAHVFVDGHDTHRMTPIPPMHPLRLPAGEHRITLRNGTDEKTVSVTVMVGQTARFFSRVP